MALQMERRALIRYYQIILIWFSNYDGGLLLTYIQWVVSRLDDVTSQKKWIPSIWDLYGVLMIVYDYCLNEHVCICCKTIVFNKTYCHCLVTDY